jgi:hypothetical protein
MGDIGIRLEISAWSSVLRQSPRKDRNTAVDIISGMRAAESVPTCVGKPMAGIKSRKRFCIPPTP